VTVSLRAFAESDATRLAEIATASNIADGRPVVVTSTEILEELTPPNVEPSLDVVVAVDDDTIVGYGYTYMLHNPDGDERCYAFGFVDPSARGRGIGASILTTTIERAREILSSSHGRGERFVRTDCAVENTAARTLYERAGLTPVRWFSDLARPLDVPLDIATSSDVIIAPWDDFDTEVLRDVKNSAFADHWGSTPTSTENWTQLTDGYGARRDLSFVATIADTPVGLLLTHRFPADDDVVGGRYGWIDKLATLREFRGRGIASSLIAHALAAYREEGLTHAALGVDTDNPTGASRLYSNLGFVPLHGTVTYSLTLPH